MLNLGHSIWLVQCTTSVIHSCLSRATDSMQDHTTGCNHLVTIVLEETLLGQSTSLLHQPSNIPTLHEYDYVFLLKFTQTALNLELKCKGWLQ